MLTLWSIRIFTSLHSICWFRMKPLFLAWMEFVHLQYTYQAIIIMQVSSLLHPVTNSSLLWSSQLLMPLLLEILLFDVLITITALITACMCLPAITHYYTMGLGGEWMAFRWFCDAMHAIFSNEWLEHLRCYQLWEPASWRPLCQACYLCLMGTS